MGLCFQPLETISLADEMTKTFVSEICEDGRISVMTDNNVYVYTLLNYMTNEFNDMAFRKNLIQLPKSSIRDELPSHFLENFDMNYDKELYQAMAELEIRNCLDNETTSEAIKPLTLKWSPKGLQGKSFCVMAVLNNLYGLSIMVEYRDSSNCVDYRYVSNVTRNLVEQAFKDWDAVSSVIGELTIEEWKQHVLDIRPTAFEWSHLISDASGTHAILFVANPSGSVTSWKFSRIGVNSLECKPLQLVGMFLSSVKNVSFMYWKNLGPNVGALFMANDEGHVTLARVSNLNTETLLFETEQIFCEKEEKLKMTHITSIEYNGFSFIVIVFESYMKIILVSEDGTILDEVLYCSGNMEIKGLCHFKENIFLMLTKEKLKKLILDIKENKIEVNDEPVAIQFDALEYRGCGMVFSKNKIFFGIFAYPGHLEHINKSPTYAKFFIYYNSSVSPIEMILKNTDRELVEYLDYFEVLRMLSIKEKKFPFEGMQDIDYNKLTLPQLKSLRWISKLSEAVYNIVPKIKGYKIKPYVLLHHFVTAQLVLNRMKKLLKELSQGKKLSVFQMRSLDISNMYLKELVLMKILEKCKVGEEILDDIISVMEVANELEYPDMLPCFWCKEKIIGPSCIPAHKDSRCCISMMQVFLTPGFKCPFCECVAHIEMSKEYDTVKCPYCDVEMYERYSLKNVQELLENTDELTRKKMEIPLQMDVPEDNNDTIGYEDWLEDLENSTECLAISGSDEEEKLEEERCSLMNEFFDTNRTNLDASEDLYRRMYSFIENDSDDNRSKETENMDDPLR